MKNPAREKFRPMLSPYVDGELKPEERLQVEQHLQNNKESAAEVADFRAADGLIRHALDLQADEVDWKRFADDVMARVTPEKLPLWGRITMTLGELYLYRRGPLIAGFAGAAVALAVAVPVVLKLTASAPAGYANSKLEVQTVSVETPGDVRPVVVETDQGDAIIWTVDARDDADGGKTKRPNDEAGEEDVVPAATQQEGPL